MGACRAALREALEAVNAGRPVAPLAAVAESLAAWRPAVAPPAGAA
jgi:hypothetical protein